MFVKYFNIFNELVSMSVLGIDNKLKELKFPDRFVITEILNKIRLQNVNKNYTDIVDFLGQLEIGTETSIPHYQLATLKLKPVLI